MTHPTAIQGHQDDDDAVRDAQDYRPVEDLAGADAAAPHLQAIQQSYEEARACIVDLARLSPSSPDWTDPFPETEKIDVRTVKPPVVQDLLPGTEAMTVAAKFLAEVLVQEEAPSPAGASQPPSQHEPASSPDGAEAPPAGLSAEAGAPLPGRRRWWRGLRSALHGAVPATRRDH